MEKLENGYLLSEKEYNDLIQIEKDMTSFIDNNQEDMLIHTSYDWQIVVKLFGKKQFEELCEYYFGHEQWFISKLLTELDTRTLEDIVKSYQYNIWHNQWMADAFNQFSKQMAELTQLQEEEVKEKLQDKLKDNEQVQQ